MGEYCVRLYMPMFVLCVLCVGMSDCVYVCGMHACVRMLVSVCNCIYIHVCTHVEEAKNQSENRNHLHRCLCSPSNK